MGGAHEGGRAHGDRTRSGSPGPSPIATLRVRHAPLQGAEVGAEDVPAAIDELPLVALLGCFAEGETVVSGAAELRHKESDRIAAVVEGLTRAGRRDRGDRRRLHRAGHRRPARRHASTPAATTAWRCSARSPGLASRGGGRGEGFEAVAVSYPRFERDLRSLIG